MELWFFYAIIGSISIGINSYFVKVLVDRKVEGSILTFSQGGIYFFIGGIQALIQGDSFSSLVSLNPMILYSISIGIVIFLHIRLRAIALKYLSSSEYYIGYRVILTILLAFLGILFLGESITKAQLFGLILGSIAITFLFEEDERLRHSRNWDRAIGFLALSILAGVAIQVLGKMQGVSDFSFPLLLFVQGIVMLLLSSILDQTSIYRFFDREKIVSQNLALILVGCLFVYVSAMCNLYAYHAGGSVSLVTKIYAYSLFVPIFLSIIFSGEKLTYKKTIAIFLTIVSLYYMV